MNLRPKIEQIVVAAEAAYEGCGRDWAQFAQRSAGILQSALDRETLSINQLATFSADFLGPPQNDPGLSFGTPPVTIYRSERVTVDMYFWQGLETSIHSHGFAGAFHTMSGLSLQQTYRFESHEICGCGCLVGVLSPERTDWIPGGTVLEIAPGAGFIHRVWHISPRVATLVLRTTRSVLDGQAQYDYFAPSFAQPATQRAKREAERARLLLRLVLKDDATSFGRIARQALARLSLCDLTSAAAELWCDAIRDGLGGDILFEIESLVTDQAGAHGLKARESFRRQIDLLNAPRDARPDAVAWYALAMEGFDAETIDAMLEEGTSRQWSRVDAVHTFLEDWHPAGVLSPQQKQCLQALLTEPSDMHSIRTLRAQGLPLGTADISAVRRTFSSWPVLGTLLTAGAEHG